MRSTEHVPKGPEEDDYLNRILEGEKDDSELLNILAYRGQLYYDSLKRIRKLKEELGRKKGYQNYYSKLV